MKVMRIKDFFAQPSGIRKWVRARNSNANAETNPLDVACAQDPAVPPSGLRKWLHRPFFWLAVLPIMLGTLFFGFIATDMYVSEASMTVRTSKGLATDVSSGSMLSLTPTNTDSYVVYEYIRSPDILRQLDAEIGLRAHYANRKADVFTRLSKTATDEELLKYYQGVVGVSLDSVTGIIKLKVRAYDPTFAHRLAQKIIKYSEDLVNKMSERSVRDTLLLAQSELARAEARSYRARIKIKDFRLRHSDFNPVMSSAGTMTMLAGLEAEQAKTSTELTQLRSFMREDSPQVVTAKSKVEALSSQIAAERSRLTGGSDSGKPDQVLEYEALVMEQEFSSKVLEGCLRAMEQARVNADSKTRYLEAFVQPNLPEEATYPERLLCIGLTTIVILLFYGIVSLSWAAIKEHAGF